MTDQTITVPVSLIRDLEKSNPTSALISGSPVSRLLALIPTLPKVGDVLTAEQIDALPTHSVLRDPEGDIWVVGKGQVGLVTGLTYEGGNMRVNPAIDATEVAGFKPVLVSLPDVE